MQKFKIVGKPLLEQNKWKERKKEDRKKKRKRRIMQSLVATTSALARKPCVSTHYVRTNKMEQLSARGRQGKYKHIVNNSPVGQIIKEGQKNINILCADKHVHQDQQIT